MCVACRHYWLETLGTLFDGKRTSVELIVRVMAGLGLRGTARGYEVDPNPVRQWRVEAAEQLRAFSQPFLRDVRVQQVQRDALFALLSAVKDGIVSEAEAISRSWSERPSESGWRWTPRANCFSLSTAASAPARWPHEGSGQNDVKMHAKTESKRFQYNRANPQ